MFHHHQPNRQRWRPGLSGIVPTRQQAVRSTRATPAHTTQTFQDSKSLHSTEKDHRLTRPRLFVKRQDTHRIFRQSYPPAPNRTGFCGVRIQSRHVRRWEVKFGDTVIARSHINRNRKYCNPDRRVLSRSKNCLKDLWNF